MGKQTPHITGAELRILKVLWATGPQTVRQVKDALTVSGESPPAYTTVMTMMQKLADKGALRVNRESQTFVYAPAVPRRKVLGERLTEFLKTVFDGRAEDMVLQLAEDAELSAEDLRRLESKIASREQIDKKGKTRSSRSKGKTR